MTSRLLTCAKVFVSAQCQHGERTTNSACCFSLRESFSVIIALRLTSALFLFGTVISLDIYIPSVPYQVVAFFFSFFFFFFFLPGGRGVVDVALRHSSQMLHFVVSCLSPLLSLRHYYPIRRHSCRLFLFLVVTLSHSCNSFLISFFFGQGTKEKQRRLTYTRCMGRWSKFPQGINDVLMHCICCKNCRIFS